MCNCKNKRSQFREVPTSKRRRIFQENPETPAKPEKNRVFEYLGTGQLLLRGNSGTIYRFSKPGARLEVPYEDSFALMAESELRLAT